MIRLVSNYLRLALTFALGIVTVRLMAEIGPDAVLIFLLLISSAGIAAMFKFALQNALVPALGLSIDGQGDFEFPRVLWVSFVLATASGIVSILLFGLFWLFSDSLNVGDLSQRTITIAIAGTALQALASSIGVVFLNLILVEERIVAYNVLLVADRALILLAVVLIYLLPDEIEIGTRLEIFYISVGVLTLVLQLVTYWLAVHANPGLRPQRQILGREETRWIGQLIGWNAVVVIAFALFTRWPPLIVNWSMDEAMTLTIGIVLALIGYQRQVSMGLVVGIDAIVSRAIGGGEADRQSGANTLILRTTYILSTFSAFSVVAIGLFVEPILALWFGDTLTGTGWTTKLTGELFLIMSLGIAFSIISEGWMKYLSGLGEVRSYAPHLLVAGSVNALAVIIAATMLEGDTALRVIALVFSASFAVVNLGFIAVTTAQRLEARLAPFFAIIALPMVAAALCVLPGMVLLEGGWTIAKAFIQICVLGGSALAMLVLMRRVFAMLRLS